MTKFSVKTQNLIGCGLIAMLLLLTPIIYVVWSAYSFVKSATSFSTSTEREVPDELRQARIITGDSFLRKSDIFKIKKEHYLQTISKSVGADNEKERAKIVESETAKGIYGFSDLRLCNGELIAGGEFGGYAFDLEGNLKREILFEPTAEKIKLGWYEQTSYKTNLDNLQVIELRKGETCGFISHGSISGVTVYDDQGNIFWSYGKRNIDVGVDWTKSNNLRDEKHVLEVAAGDLDNDGTTEFIVAINNDGIHAFDFNGAEKWFQPDEFPYNQLIIDNLKSAQRRQNQLIECGTNSKVRDENGNVIKNFLGKENCLIWEKPEGGRELLFVELDDKGLKINNENGNTILQANAPLSVVKLKEPKKIEVPFHPEYSYTNDSENVYHPKCVWVNIHGKKYLAVVGSYIGMSRSQFYVYNAKGNLAYQELLPEEAKTIAVLPNQQGTENIIVGGTNTIWKFAAN